MWVSIRKLACAGLVVLTHVMTALSVYIFFNESPRTFHVRTGPSNYVYELEMGKIFLSSYFSGENLNLTEHVLHREAQQGTSVDSVSRVADDFRGASHTSHIKGSDNHTQVPLSRQVSTPPAGYEGGKRLPSDATNGEVAVNNTFLLTQKTNATKDHPGSVQLYHPLTETERKHLLASKGYHSPHDEFSSRKSIRTKLSEIASRKGITEHNQMPKYDVVFSDHSDPIPEGNLSLDVSGEFPAIFVITPTHTRMTQKVDLTSLCYTFTLVPHLVWIVVEDSYKKTRLVTNLLTRCNVTSIHLNARTSLLYRRYMGHPKWMHYKGVVQRNFALRWLRRHCSSHECNGVVYFADDDNKYDLRLFEEIRNTKVVSVFIVAFAGGMKFEGPLCENGVAKRWYTAWDTNRTFPLDMAGYAINVHSILYEPMAWFGRQKRRAITKELQSSESTLETTFLEYFATRETVECKGTYFEPYVWHTKTMEPLLNEEDDNRSAQYFSLPELYRIEY